MVSQFVLHTLTLASAKREKPKLSGIAIVSIIMCFCTFHSRKRSKSAVLSNISFNFMLGNKGRPGGGTPTGGSRETESLLIKSSVSLRDGEGPRRVLEL